MAKDGQPRAGSGKTPPQRKTPRRTRKKKPEPKRPGLLRRLIRFVVRGTVAALAIVVTGVVALAALYRGPVDPPGGPYMLGEWLRLGHIEHVWRPMTAISPSLARAVVAAEDARFCSHTGIDGKAIADAIDDYQREGRMRGASTITQQTAKNVFLWQGRTLFRKGLEVPLAGLIEMFWGKRRILEVYLNVAEFGEGVFGAEAAARHYFNVTAAELTLGQSTRLATILPNPKVRNPNALSGGLKRRARQIEAGARTIAARGDDDCFLF